MGPDAHLHKINKITTGASREELERFLKKVDNNQLPSIAEATAKMHERAEAREAGAQLMRTLYPVQPRPEFERSSYAELKSVVRDARYVASVVVGDKVKAASRFAGRILDFGTKTLEALLAPILTPEQKRLGELATQAREWDGAEAERRRRRHGGYERD